MTACNFCHAELDPNDPTVYRKVTGWERKGAGTARKGGSDVVLRSPVTDQFACPGCIVKMKAGISVNQQSMF